MNRFASLCVAALAVLGLTVSAFAQEHVLRDHLQAVRLTDGNGSFDLLSVGATNFNEVPIVAGNSGRAISGFQGDGDLLHSYSAFYVFDVPISGVLNFSATDFRLSFWANQSRMLSDPELLNPQAGDHVFVFDTPVNANWQTPIVTVHGIGVYRFDFDLDAAGVYTTSADTQFLSLCVQGSRDDLGQAYSLPSLGGQGTIGTDLGWIWFPAGGLGQTPMLWQDLPGFPAIGLADRITTIPAPGNAALLGCALLMRRRHR